MSIDNNIMKQIAEQASPLSSLEAQNKLVYVCSPLRGDIAGNIEKANGYCREIALKGNIPLAPHCVFTQYLNDNNPKERELGIKMGLNLLNKCDYIVICGDRISEGMLSELYHAYSLEIPVLYYDDEVAEMLMKSAGSFCDRSYEMDNCL
ncbi:hypothetical protein LJB89_03995 [Tyzzerella sp. OttesenSCG-928-J15]|nr:hypothetical protein [Tyzzerella sp. OttesenSCG-928-J15]